MPNLKTALDYAKQGCDTLINKFTVEELPPANRYHYHQGVFLSGMERTYLLSKEEKYGNYIKDWHDHYINQDGELAMTIDQFDDMQPAIMLFGLYQKTGDTRYKKVLDQFAPIVDQWPKNAYGGFWHKYFRPNQMWLDSLYMIGPYAAMYGQAFDKPYFFEVVLQQATLMRNNMRDPNTGLLYHAWDHSRLAEWAGQDTGLSSQFWGRAIGWYAVALLDILDYVPQGHHSRQNYVDMAIEIIEALIKFQCPKTGLWRQVVNRVDDPANWYETSCTSLFTYAIAKAVKVGILDAAYLNYATKGYQGVIDGLTFEGDNLIVSNICVGTGVGDYEFYLNRPTVANDLHGMGAFVLMCTEYFDAMAKQP